MTPMFSKGPAGEIGLRKISFPELASPTPDLFTDELQIGTPSKLEMKNQPSFGPPKEIQQQDLSAPDLTDKETQTEQLMLQSIPNMRDANINAHQGGC